MEIAQPWVWDELLEYPRGLADRELQRATWLPHEGCFDYVVHFLCDDFPDARRGIGSYLRDDGEAAAVSLVQARILVLLDAYGTELEDPEYIAKPEWSGIVDSAREALEVLARASTSGRPTRSRCPRRPQQAPRRRACRRRRAPHRLRRA